MDAYVIGIAAAGESVAERRKGGKEERRKGGKEGGGRTHERYDTERKGFWLKTSLSRNRFSKSQDIGCDGVGGALLGWADGLGGRRRGDLKVGEGGRTRPMSGSCTPCSLVVLDVVDLAGLVGFVGLGVASAGAGAGAVAESWCVQLLQHGCRPVLASFVVCVSRRRRRSREKSSRARRRRIRE